LYPQALEAAVSVDIRELVAKHGATSKLVRAICRANGWRHAAQGAPPEWFAWWRAGGGLAIEHAITPSKRS